MEEHLQIIEYLLAGLLLKKEVDVKRVAKILGCSDNVITELYPAYKGGKHGKK